MGLFKPAWMTDKEKKLPKALDAVEQMTSQSELNQVALSAPLAPVAQAAISRITDDELLLEIARNRFNDEVGLAAVGHVDDQDALVRFMIVDKPTGAVGKAVFKRIKLDQVSDRERLTALAHCAPTADARSKVLAMLDYEELMDVYLRADDTRLAHEALDKVDNPDWLYEKLLELRNSGWEDEKKVSILEAVIDQVDDKEKLLFVARSVKIKPSSKSKFLSSTESRSFIARAKALRKATDIEWPYDELSKNMSRIHNPESLLKHGLREADDPEFARLELEADEPSLREVFQDEGKPLIHRIAAANRLRSIFCDSGPYQELADASTEMKGHLLFQTEYVFWERQASMCICCYEEGGSYEDDGRTHHFGCEFWREACTGDPLPSRIWKASAPVGATGSTSASDGAISPVPTKAKILSCDHEWDGCICARCGKTRNEGHEWNGCTCVRCGAWRNKEHAYEPVRGGGSVCSICKMFSPTDPPKSPLQSLQCGPDERKRVFEERSDDQEFLLQAALHAPSSGTMVEATRHLTDLEALSTVASTGQPKAAKAALARVAELYPDELQAVRELAVMGQIGQTRIDEAVKMRKIVGEPSEAEAFDLRLVDALVGIVGYLGGDGNLAKDAVPLVRTIRSDAALLKLASLVRFENPVAAASADAIDEAELLPANVIRMLSDEQLVAIADGADDVPEGGYPAHREAIAHYARLQIEQKATRK